MQVTRITNRDRLWDQAILYAENCSWIAGKHLAQILRENRFTDWESLFAATEGDEIIGFCTLMKEDYYPDNKYQPWISNVFVDETARGHRVSQILVDAAALYAGEMGHDTVYIPSDLIGLYEKYGFEKIDELQNYGGGVDSIFARQTQTEHT